MPLISITTPNHVFQAELGQGPTAKAVYDALPIAGKANTWGDEFYFAIPIKTQPEPGAADQLPAGSLAFWPPGNAFCAIWGPTPASHGSEPRFASAVNPLGKILGDLSPLARIRDGDTIRIEKA